MACEKFRDCKFNDASLTRIGQAEAIIDEYLVQNLRLTLRQLYYQFVSRDLITNKPESYKQLGDTISKGRLAGLLDWDAIEDRGRQPYSAGEFDNLKELVDAALYTYRLPRWADQEHYVELWVEKDALAGVLRPLAREFHVTMMVNRGYSSQSAMYESANRFKEKDGKYLTLLYLGDHDPSGEDMVRDIADLTFCKIMIRDAPSFHPRASISIRELRQDEINELPVDTRAELGRVTRMIMLAQRRSQP